MGSRIVRGLKPLGIYNIQVNAENYYGVGEWSDVYQHTCGDYSTPSHLPATATVTTKETNFLIRWDAVTDRDVTGYGLWANTVNAFAGSKLFKRVRKPVVSGIVSIHTTNLTDGTTELEYDTDYYWFITSTSSNDIDSATATTCTGNPARVNKADIIRSFSMPWKMQGLGIVRESLVGSTVETVYTVPTSYVVSITGYKLSGSYIMINDNNLDFGSTSDPVTRSPQFTQGLFLGAGATITLTGASTGVSSWWRGKKFYADSDISSQFIILKSSCASHQVTTNKNFYLTYCIVYDPVSTGVNLEESTAGGGSTNFNVVIEYPTSNDRFSIGTAGGVISFPSDTYLDSFTDSNLITVGYEVTAP